MTTEDFTSRQDAAANALSWATEAHAQMRQAVETLSRSGDEIGGALYAERAVPLIARADGARQMALMWTSVAALLPDAVVGPIGGGESDGELEQLRMVVERTRNEMALHAGYINPLRVMALLDPWMNFDEAESVPTAQGDQAGGRTPSETCRHLTRQITTAALCNPQPGEQSSLLNSIRLTLGSLADQLDAASDEGA